MPRARAPLHIAVPVAIAAAVRLVHFGLLAARDPLFRVPVVDGAFHAAQARTILDKGVLLTGQGAFYKGPLYSYELAVLDALFGRSGGAAAGRLASIVFGCVAVWLAARLAERLGGPRAAWAAGLAAALYGTAVYYDTALLQVSLATALLCGTALLLTAAAERRAPVGALALAGACAGLNAITRADALLAVLAAAGWAAWAARGSRWPGVRPWRALALVAVPAALVVAPVTARNALLERDPVLVSWNGGINLFMGNDPGFDQTSGNWHPDLSWMRLYDAPADLGQVRGAEHQRFFVRQTIDAALADPGGTLARLGRKALILCGAYEIANNQRYEEGQARSPLLAVLMFRAPWFAFPAGLAIPLIGAGLVLGAGRARGRAVPGTLVAAAWLLVPVLFFNTARYRLPALVLLLALAAPGWVALPAAWRAGERRRVALAACVALALLLVANATIPAHPRLPPSEELLLADAVDQDGDRPRALELRLAAVAREPHDPFARIRAGDTLRAVGRHEDAIAQYRAVLDEPGLAEEWTLAATRSTARCLLSLKRHGEAAAWYARFLDAHPDAPMTGVRPDFHLRGVPPLADCKIRLEYADAVRLDHRPKEALAELATVARECAVAPDISARAQKELLRLTSAMRGLPPDGPQR